MLHIDHKRVTKELDMNNIIGKFKGKEIKLPSHKTKNGIVVFAFKLKFKDLVKAIFSSRLYVQQVPTGKNKDRVAISIALTEKDCNEDVQANEDYIELNSTKTEKGSES